MADESKDAAAAAAEAKAAADAAAAQEAEKAAKAAAEQAGAAGEARVVPETYTFTLPEKTLLDPKVTDRLSAFAKAHKLTQGEAAAVLGLAHAEVGETLQALDAANAPPSKEQPLGGALYQARVAEFAKAALAHPDLGAGDARKLEAAVLKAQLFVNQHAPELKPLLERSGDGSNPDVLLVLNRFAAMIAERPHVKDAGAPPPKPPTDPRSFYAPDGGKKVVEPATA